MQAVSKRVFYSSNRNGELNDWWFARLDGRSM